MVPRSIKLLRCHSDILAEVETQIFEVYGITFPIEYFLCSDLNFLTIVCGIESANSAYVYMWCTCPSSERHDIKKSCQLQIQQKGHVPLQT